MIFRGKIRCFIKYRVLTDTSPLVGYMPKTVNWGAVASGGGLVGPGGASLSYDPKRKEKTAFFSVK